VQGIHRVLRHWWCSAAVQQQQQRMLSVWAGSNRRSNACIRRVTQLVCDIVCVSQDISWLPNQVDLLYPFSQRPHGLPARPYSSSAAVQGSE
jgi:hypothetical protein